MGLLVLAGGAWTAEATRPWVRVALGHGCCMNGGEMHSALEGGEERHDELSQGGTRGGMGQPGLEVRRCSHAGSWVVAKGSGREMNSA